jgi:hypothetical protein
MKKLFIVLAVMLLMSGGCGLGWTSEIIIKEGVSYSIPDADFGAVTLFELYRPKQEAWKDLSLNGGVRKDDTIIPLDIGYDLNKLTDPIKIIVQKIPVLNVISPILNQINPSLDIYSGWKRPTTDNEFDYGVNIVARLPFGN